MKQAAERETNKAPQVTKPGTNKTTWVATLGETQNWFARLDSLRFVPNDTSFAQAMGVRAATATVISPDAKTAINGYSVVAVVKPDKDRQVDQISFSLNYDPQLGEGWAIPADPPMVLNSTNPAQTSWPHPDNCQDLTLDRVAFVTPRTYLDLPPKIPRNMAWPIFRPGRPRGRLNRGAKRDFARRHAWRPPLDGLAE